MFDGTGRLVCEPDLATAPALALLLMHDDVVTKENHVKHKIRQCAFTWVYVFAEMSSHSIQILLSRLLIIWVSMNQTRQL